MEKTDHTDFNDERIHLAIAKLLRVPMERVVPEASLAADLEMDSLSFMDLIMGLESSFAVRIPDQDAARLTNVAEVVAILKALQKDSGCDRSESAS